MFGTKRARQVRIVAALGTVLGLAAAAAISGAAFARSMQRIAIERQGEVRVIAIDGMAQASYSASRAEKPRRIVVDFDDVRIGKAESQKTVFDGLVEEVTLAEFQTPSGKTATRLEVTLASDATFEFARDGERLLLQLDPARQTQAQAPVVPAGEVDVPAVSAGPAEGEAPVARASSSGMTLMPR